VDRSAGFKITTLKASRQETALGITIEEVWVDALCCHPLIRFNKVLMLQQYTEVILAVLSDVVRCGRELRRTWR
jgi:hypothetical protein